MIPRRAARQAVRSAQIRGLLPVRPPRCEVCGVEGREFQRSDNVPGGWSIQYHHHDYDPAYHLDVVAVCTKCHNAIHFGRIPEPRTGELRTGARVKRTRPHTVWAAVVPTDDPAFGRVVSRHIHRGAARNAGTPVVLFDGTGAAQPGDLLPIPAGERVAPADDPEFGLPASAANARAQLARWAAEGVQRPPWVRR